MKSSTILSKYKRYIDKFIEIYSDDKIPNFIREVMEFGRCIYYLERYPRDKNLIFKTKNIDRWEASREELEMIITILMQNRNIDERVKFNFEVIGNLDEDLEQLENKESYDSNILFSGGADSMCGAFHYVKKLRKKALFTHIYHRNTPSKEMLRNFIKNELNMDLILINGLFKNDENWRSLGAEVKSTEMNLNQTRTLFYLCNTVPINYIYGIQYILITENGPLTINPQFTELSEFTNSTDPEFIEYFNRFLDKYFGVKKLIKVDLPFRNYTKAELMASVPAEVLIKTHSCSRNFYNKVSCLKCYPCFIRRFSAYSYENFQDDIYNPIGKEFNRYKSLEKSIFMLKKNNFEEDKSNNLIIHLIDFCKDTLNRKNIDIYHEKYPGVFKKFIDIGDRGLYYRDFWNLLERYSLDILSGIYRFFKQNRTLENREFYIYDYFTNVIYDLIAKEILSSDYFKLRTDEIKTQANSIVGELT